MSEAEKLWELKDAQRRSRLAEQAVLDAQRVLKETRESLRRAQGRYELGPNGYKD